MRKRFWAALLAFSILGIPAFAQRSGVPSAPKRGPSSSSQRINSGYLRTYANRPYYGGRQHTISHGGHYLGETNVHHKGGHYSNPKTGDRYGIHKPR